MVEIRAAPVTSRATVGAALPIPTLLLVVSTFSTGVVEPDGCTWKAVTELVEFLARMPPPSATVKTAVPVSWRLNIFPVLVLFTFSAVAAPAWTILSAVAAVPLVPLTALSV